MGSGLMVSEMTSAKSLLMRSMLSGLAVRARLEVGTPGKSGEMIWRTKVIPADEDGASNGR